MIAHRLSAAALLGCSALAALAGCDSGPPPLHAVTGKVTLGGKSYPRLLVYFRPAAGKVTESNHAVGETDPDGNLGIRSAAGDGLEAGTYRVTFALYRDRRTGAAVGGADKPDEAGVVTRQVVPPPYDEETSRDATPVTFTVAPGGNTFTFDVPAK